MPPLDPKGIFQADVELVVVLKGINGSTGGFFHNVGNRVIDQLLYPDEEGAPSKFPYLSLPKVDDNPVMENHEHGVTIRYRQPVYGFISEKSSKGIVSTAKADAAKLHDDIVKVILNNHTLNGRVKNCIPITGGTSFAAINIDDDFGFFVIFLELMVIAGKDNLGPP